VPSGGKAPQCVKTAEKAVHLNKLSLLLLKTYIENQYNPQEVFVQIAEKSFDF